MNKEESIGDSVVENENVAINQDEIDTSESSVENQVNVSSDIEEAQQGANDDLVNTDIMGDWKRLTIY